MFIIADRNLLCGSDRIPAGGKVNIDETVARRLIATGAAHADVPLQSVEAVKPAQTQRRKGRK